MTRDTRADGVPACKHEDVVETPTGMARFSVGRKTSGQCVVCRLDCGTLAGAVSHSRATGHVVRATYHAAYLYADKGITDADMAAVLDADEDGPWLA